MKQLFYLVVILCCVNVNNAFAANGNIANFIPNAATWSSYFPNANSSYSYQNFKDAVNELSDYSVEYAPHNSWGTSVTVTRKSTNTSYTYIITSGDSWTSDPVVVDFEEFCNTGDDFMDKRELAAFFANISQETTGGTTDVFSGQSNSHSQWGLYWLEELGQPCCTYQDDTYSDYKDNYGQAYYGRGAIQLSYPYNYGRFSDFMYNDDGLTLLQNPGLVASSGVLAFQSAIWFWMVPQCPKPSCHQVMQEIHDETVGSYTKQKMSMKGFAHTVNIINGQQECRSLANQANANRRADFYSYFLDKLGFSVAQRNAENDNITYTSQCASSAVDVMENYTQCAFKSVASCTNPALGPDDQICGSNLTLDANITLANDEAIAWYRDNNLLNGETQTTLEISSDGTYKAIVSGVNCTTREDEVSITQGGTLSLNASNEGVFCETTGPENVVINVSAGGGFYNFYDVATGGSPLSSGSDFTVTSTELPIGQSKTYYVEESSGVVSTIGLDAKPPADSDFIEYRFAEIDDPVSDGYINLRTNFTTYSDVVLQSIDFLVANIGNGNPAELTVEVYTQGGSSPIESKTFDLENTPFVDWDQKLSTYSLNFSLPAGNYELSIFPSNVSVWLAQYDNGTKTFPYSSWIESGVASIDNMFYENNPEWGTNEIIHMGAYNWTFSTGGSSSSCGRAGVLVTHDCTTALNELSNQSFTIFPNPVNEVMNFKLNDINTGNLFIEVYNQVGQLVTSNEFNNVSNNQIQISTADLQDGLYFVKLTSGTKVFSASVAVTKQHL